MGFTAVLQAGMTQSFGNGRRLDDGKALGELDFQVQDKISSFQLHPHNMILLRFLVLTSVVLIMQIGDYLDVAII